MAVLKIGFSTARHNPISWIIRKLTRSRASHAWLQLTVQPFDLEMVFEATEWGVRLVPWRIFRRHNRIVARFEPLVPLDAGLVEAKRWLGARYDFGGLLGMFFVVVGRLLGRKRKNPWNSAKAMFCSELVTTVLIGSGYPGAREHAPSQTSPQDLLDFLEQSAGENTAANPTATRLAAP
jgi:hypothetical protein